MTVQFIHKYQFHVLEFSQARLKQWYLVPSTNRKDKTGVLSLLKRLRGLVYFLDRLSPINGPDLTSEVGAYNEYNITKK